MSPDKTFQLADMLFLILDHLAPKSLAIDAGGGIFLVKVANAPKTLMFFSHLHHEVVEMVVHHRKKLMIVYQKKTRVRIFQASMLR